MAVAVVVAVGAEEVLAEGREVAVCRDLLAGL